MTDEAPLAMTLGDPGAPPGLVRVQAPKLGILLSLVALVGRSPRPMRCERCGRRRIVFRAEVQLRPAQEGVVRPAIQPGVVWLASPAVCADCAELRVRDDPLDSAPGAGAPSAPGPVQGAATEETP